MCDYKLTIEIKKHPTRFYLHSFKKKSLDDPLLVAPNIGFVVQPALCGRSAKACKATWFIGSRVVSSGYCGVLPCVGRLKKSKESFQSY